MITTNRVGRVATKLRQRAEEIERESSQTPEPLEALSPEAAQQLIQELRVYQIELEMQNEELRQTQETLDDIRARYFDMYNLAPVGYLVIDRNGTILEANQTFAQLLGIDRAVLPKKMLSNYIMFDDQDAFYLHRKRLFDSGELQSLALRMLKKDGSTIWALLNQTLVEDKDGANVCRIVVSDITKQKFVEDALTESNLRLEEALRIKAKFLATMSHELRTPLNAIIGFAEVLQDKLFGPIKRKQKHYIMGILSSGRHLLSLINDMLDISKVEAGKMELALERVKILPLCKEILSTFKRMAKKRQIALNCVVECDMDDLLVVVDRRKIMQILNNLVDNAIKFNNPGGSVSITVNKTADNINSPAIQIVVEDTGIGIAEEDMAKLFLPFSQLTPQTDYQKNADGTGLGLALTKHLVELHGGEIYVESELGKGSRFVVSIPVQAEPVA